MTSYAFFLTNPSRTCRVILDGNRCTVDGKPLSRGATMDFIRQCARGGSFPLVECPGCHTILEAHLVNGICDGCKAEETADTNMEARCEQD